MDAGFAYIIELVIYRLVVFVQKMIFGLAHERHNDIFQPSKIELFLDEIEQNFIVHSMFHFIQVLSNHLWFKLFRSLLKYDI